MRIPRDSPNSRLQISLNSLCSVWQNASSFCQARSNSGCSALRNTSDIARSLVGVEPMFLCVLRARHRTPFLGGLMFIRPNTLPQRRLGPYLVCDSRPDECVICPGACVERWRVRRGLVDDNGLIIDKSLAPQRPGLLLACCIDNLNPGLPEKALCNGGPIGTSAPALELTTRIAVRTVRPHSCAPGRRSALPTCATMRPT